jgi:hypothetical protein
LGNWLEKREQLWESLEADYAPIEINGQHLQPFEVEKINQMLEPWGWYMVPVWEQVPRSVFFWVSCCSVWRKMALYCIFLVWNMHVV